MGCILRIGNNKIANKGVVRIFGCVSPHIAKFLGNRIRNIKSFSLSSPLYGLSGRVAVAAKSFPVSFTK